MLGWMKQSDKAGNLYEALNQVPRKPSSRMFRHLFQRASFLEEVCCAGNANKLLLAGQQVVGCLIHFNHRFIVPTDDQQGWSGDRRQIGFSKSGRPPRDTIALM